MDEDGNPPARKKLRQMTLAFRPSRPTQGTSTGEDNSQQVDSATCPSTPSSSDVSTECYTQVQNPDQEKSPVRSTLQADKGYEHSTDPADFVGKVLSDSERVRLLTTLSQPSNTSLENLPQTSKRRFNPAWIKTRPWLRYSVKTGAFCIYCICFCNQKDSNSSPFVSSGFRNWKKAVGKESYLDQHNRSEVHKGCEDKARHLLKTLGVPGSDIMSKLKKQIADQQVRNKNGLLSIIDVVITLGQRGIPFRGTWDKTEKAEDGNFMFFVNWKSKYHEPLRDHLDNSPGNAIYTSPKIQNEIIQLCESSIRDCIIETIPKYWSVMADETQDCSTAEQLSICIRFVNDSGEVCEEFLGFVKIEKMDAATISDVLISTLIKWGLNMSCLVGQGYDGASVMSSSKNGVQAKVKEKYPNAEYVHCRAHVLNLAISSGCKGVQSVQNLFDNVGKLTWFLGGSAKRKEIFLRGEKAKQQELLDFLTTDEPEEEDSCVEQAIREGASKNTVPKFCATRWSARLSTLSALLAKYTLVLDALDTIKTESTGDAKTDAEAYIRMMEDSQFIVALVVTQFILSFLGRVTKLLQAKDCNLVDAYDDISLSKDCILKSRSEEKWKKLWGKVLKLSEEVGITITKPRTTGSQRHRSNAGAGKDQSSSDYFRVNVYFPFIDHVVQELETRFPKDHTGLIAAQYLVPAMLPKIGESQINSIREYYGKFLTREESSSLDTEVMKWKGKYDEPREKDKPKTITQTLAECSSQFFPAIHKILTILLTTPVGSVSCERSFSALRRLKLWTRSSMTQDRLSGLAMLLVHRKSSFIPSPEKIYLLKSNWR